MVSLGRIQNALAGVPIDPRRGNATRDGHLQSAQWLDAGAWTGVAGVFLGYALAYAWGLRARLR